MTRRGALAGGLLALAASPAAAQDRPDLEILLAPGPVDGAGHITRLDVTISFDAPAQSGPLAEMPVRRHTVPTSAPDIVSLAFADAAGALPVTVADTQEGDADITREWSPARAPEGAVSLRYSLAIDPDLPEFSRPQYELRTRGGTFSGAGLAFLVLPADRLERDVSLSWDLSALPEGAQALSSLGAGTTVPARALTPGHVAGSYFMAGSMHTFARGSFFAGWDGSFAFAGDELMDWAADLQQFYGSFFGIRPQSFGVFARTNSVNPGSGIGQLDSFAFTFDQTIGAERLRGLLAHEMLHAWVNSLDGSMDQPDGFASSWFGEGLAVHYQRALPYRAGLMSRAEFLADLNATAARYYTNIMQQVPNDEIGAGFWKDTRIRVLPYDRGSLYFARLDAQIRDASAGARSLDDLVRAMLQERAADRPMDLALWKRLLEAELGQSGIAEFEGMLEGTEVIVPADAFGPCFTRVSRPLRRYDLGFDPASLLSPQRAVSGLKPGSEAALAGLREGDRILNTFPQDSLQADQAGVLDLSVARGSDRLAISYQPRGETVPAWQWIEQDCSDD